MKDIAVEDVLASVRASISEASAANDGYWYGEEFGGVSKYQAASAVEDAFLKLLVLTEANGLHSLHAMIQATYRKAKQSRDGMFQTQQDEHGDIYLTLIPPLWRFVKTLEALYGASPSKQIRKDLLAILRATQYGITDKHCFPAPPRDEADVHNRTEAVLKCVFPDLRRKPPIAKPIKNFIPDTGIPSLRTLIEYKFASTMDEVGRVAEEILADTRGYVSRDWDTFIYLVYETARLKPESEWRQLLRECGTAESTDVIVICGDAVPPTAPSKAAGRKKPRESKSK